jgi:hypothetical protein
VEEIGRDPERTGRHVELDRNGNESEGDDAFARGHVLFLSVPTRGAGRLATRCGERSFGVPSASRCNYRRKARGTKNCMDDEYGPCRSRRRQRAREPDACDQDDPAEPIGMAEEITQVATS